MNNKPFYELEISELAKMDPALVEYQIQEGLTTNRGIASNAVASAMEIEALRRTLRQQQDNTDKKTEWWKTFRAALTGCLARSDDRETATRHATETANYMHGKLE